VVLLVVVQMWYWFGDDFEDGVLPFDFGYFNSDAKFHPRMSIRSLQAHRHRLVLFKINCRQE
jgi:hypothetical protein